jgi:hypothetical protein
MELSGSEWVARFPTSASVDDLADPSKSNVQNFLSALNVAGASVTITATLRPPQRAYLMHWSWHIAKGLDDASDAPAMDGVDITWVHPDGTSVQAAQDMVDGYGMAYANLEPYQRPSHRHGYFRERIAHDSEG